MAIHIRWNGASIHVRPTQEEANELLEVLKARREHDVDRHMTALKAARGPLDPSVDAQAADDELRAAHVGVFDTVEVADAPRRPRNRTEFLEQERAKADALEHDAVEDEGIVAEDAVLEEQAAAEAIPSTEHAPNAFGAVDVD